MSLFGLVPELIVTVEEYFNPHSRPKSLYIGHIAQSAEFSKGRVIILMRCGLSTEKGKITLGLPDGVTKCKKC